MRVKTVIISELYQVNIDPSYCTYFTEVFNKVSNIFREAGRLRMVKAEHGIVLRRGDRAHRAIRHPLTRIQKTRIASPELIDIYVQPLPLTILLFSYIF